MTHHLLRFGALLILAADVHADPQTLVWFTSDQPPQFILSGPDKGQGAIDGVIGYFQAELPEYNHVLSVNNIQRTFNELQAGGTGAAAGVVKTPEREKLALFSEPFAVALPPGFLIRKADLPLMQPYLNGGSLDLAAFLDAGRRSVGVAAGRSYGPAIDELLAAHQGERVVSTRFADTGIMAGLVQMLTVGRVDAVFAYRSEVRYVIRDEALLRSLTVLPVVPLGNMLTIHVAVPRTDWGRTFLQKLNPIILKARVDPAFRALSDRWSDDETRALVLKTLQNLH